MTQEFNRLIGFSLIILGVFISILVTKNKRLNKIKSIIISTIISFLGFGMLIL